SNGQTAFPAQQVCGPDGLFELWLPSWKHPDLRVEAPGFAAVLVEVAREHETQEKAMVVLLSRAASLHARLLDAGGGSIADGEVRLWTNGYNVAESDHGDAYLPSISESAWKESTDSSGQCMIQSLPPNVPLNVEILRSGRTVKRDLPTLSLVP